METFGASHFLKKVWRTLRNNKVPPIYICPGFREPADILQMCTLHRLACRYRYYRLPLSTQRALRLLHLLLWPFRLLELSAKLTRRGSSHHTHRLIFFLKIVFWALRYSIPPKAFFNYDIQKKSDIKIALQYLYDQEASSLFPYLNYFAKQPEISDKYAFSKLCEKYGLASVPVIGLAENGRTMPAKDILATLSNGFFCKPQYGARGKHARGWRYNEKQELIDAKGRCLSLQEAYTLVLADARHQPIIFQPHLISHTELNDLSFQNICTVRIVTVREKDKAPYFFRAVLKIPREHCSENTSGLFSAIDEATGILGRCFSYRLECPGADTHVDNNAFVKGRQLPDWQRVKNLAIEAHTFFPDYLFLGWDIALTNTGPRLLEVNECWDVLTLQRAHQKPLGQTEFAAICTRRIQQLSTPPRTQ